MRNLFAPTKRSCFQHKLSLNRMPYYNYKRARIDKRTRDVINEVVEKKLSAAEEQKVWDVQESVSPALNGWGTNVGAASTNSRNLCAFTDTAGTTGIGVGSGVNGRIGLRIHIKEIQFSIMINPTPGTGVPAHADGFTCRVIVVQDKQWKNQNAAAFDALDYMQTSNIASLYNHNNRQNYKILRDFQHNMTVTSDNGTIVTAGTPRIFRFSVYPNIKVVYSGVNGVLSEITDNNIFLMLATDSANCCNFTVQRRVIYTEAAS